MSVIDQHTGQPDPGLEREARLEREIDAAYEAMVTAPTDAESREWFTELNVLLGRRTRSTWLKIELERRLEAKQRREAAR